MTVDIEKLAGCHILVVGDLMLDAYLWGEAERISPEAPVQVVSVTSEEHALGGAGNVINNLVALGAQVSAVGVIGSGPDAQLILNRLNALGVHTGGVIQDPQRPTTRKTRVIANHQHVLRFDREVKTEINRQLLSQILQSATDRIAATDLILVSDYGKGLITKKLMQKLNAAAQKHGKRVIVDPKGLDFAKYAGASLITPNQKETALAAGIDIVDHKTLAQAARRLIKKTGIDKILVTCGKDGMVYFERNARPYRIRTKARQVFDVSGAGDTVLAVLGLAIAAGYAVKEAVALSNTAAGIVVGKVGTAPVSKSELAASLNLIPDPTLHKQKTVAALTAVAQKLQKSGKRIVLTNGCFDLLHVGHIKLLSASKQLGDVLVVAIDDDASVKRLKGPGRPVIKAAERLRIIGALDSVDYVVVFSSHQLNTLIEILRPAVLTKGSNYGTDTVAGREIVERFGGRVEIIPVTEDISASRIINTIKNSRTNISKDR
ncbi:MAG: D-glycero-beta-D-manno-heptose-7-phosphate kinase [Deltaproteobacteria bacterium]|jgi:D-beta-D-heptose 7-phosphate kinase/D-beta-D-heptose 1-phosphate adenosyltransferase|nr:D-glycero-beta-D-manno-heptose-7-phosphate kinase [Deltaproteobacteria bacterium]